MFIYTQHIDQRNKHAQIAFFIHYNILKHMQLNIL